MKWKLLILLIVLTGCSAEKQIFRARKIIDKYPHTLDKYMTVRDSMVYKDTTIYKDTTLYDTIEGEYRIDSILIPADITEIEPLHIQMEHMSVDVWVDEGKIYVEVDMPPVVRKWRLDSAYAQRDRYFERYQTEIFRPPPEKIPVKWYYKAALWGFAGMIFLLIVLIVILKLLKRLPKLPK
jgi:hypothetical protein